MAQLHGAPPRPRRRARSTSTWCCTSRAGRRATWALRAPVGADVGYAGPRVDFSPRDDAEWLLLCGDETALPAIAAILESPPPATELIAVVEVADGGEEQQLELPPGARLEWVHRGGAPAATTPHLADALRAVDLPEGTGQAWGAAESRVARDLRDGTAGRARDAAEPLEREGLLAALGRVARRRGLSAPPQLPVVVIFRSRIATILTFDTAAAQPVQCRLTVLTAFCSVTARCRAITPWPSAASLLADVPTTQRTRP